VKKWYDRYLWEIKAFLNALAGDLDAAGGRVLQRIAKTKGSREQQIAWLTSIPVQRALERLVAAIMVHTLDGERSFAEAKRHEARRLCHLAVASRNILLRWYHRMRTARVKLLRGAEQEVARTMKIRITSLAWQRLRRQRLIPQPLGCAGGRVAQTAADAQTAAGAPTTAAGAQTAAKNPIYKVLVGNGDRAAVNAYVQSNKEDLAREQDALRRAAKENLARVQGITPRLVTGYKGYLRSEISDIRI
jgi:hypothetical protein